jgi:hypothetical protein
METNGGRTDGLVHTGRVPRDVLQSRMSGPELLLVHSWEAQCGAPKKVHLLSFPLVPQSRPPISLFGKGPNT